jgi:hypothetical protein
VSESLATIHHIAPVYSVALAFICVVAAPDLLSDTLITNARVIDGTGATAINASVRISGAHKGHMGTTYPGRVIRRAAIQP